MTPTNSVGPLNPAGASTGDLSSKGSPVRRTSKDDAVAHEPHDFEMVPESSRGVTGDPWSRGSPVQLTIKDDAASHGAHELLPDMRHMHGL